MSKSLLQVLDKVINLNADIIDILESIKQDLKDLNAEIEEINE